MLKITGPNAEPGEYQHYQWEEDPVQEQREPWPENGVKLRRLSKTWEKAFKERSGANSVKYKIRD